MEETFQSKKSKMKDLTPQTSNGDRFVGDRFNHRVVRISLAGNIVWQYGTTGVAGSGANQLNTPTSGIPLPNNNILIGDQFNQRAIEVDTLGNIVWQYGTTGAAGSGANQLNLPLAPQRLSNGNTQISDRNNHRIIQVDSLGSIVWQYGTTGVGGSGANQLSYPAVNCVVDNPTTPVGTSVTVSPLDNVALVFSNVSATGTTSATVSVTAPAGPPSGFSFTGSFWDVQTTATYTGPITVTFPYDENLITVPEASLQLFHWEGGAWQNVTVSVDTVNNTITGQVTLLSPFAMGVPMGAGIPTGYNTYSILLLGLLALATGLVMTRRISLQSYSAHS